MLFNSYIFVLLFLPLCLVGYFSLNHFKKYRIAQFFLLGMSLWFYGYFSLKYLALILFSIVFNYGIFTLLTKNRKKIFLMIGLFVNIGLLLYFKYTDFFISTVNRIFSTDFNLLHIVLPLGISFFTFQQISFIVDAYRENLPKYDFLNYASYVAFFPQLVAGPIVTHDELIPQFMDVSKKKIDWDNLMRGIYIFTIGLFKKVILADTFGNAVNWGFVNLDLLNSSDAILIILGYTFQIYFDFSGYCDMAIGIGKMMNIDLPVNFNSPYKSLSITEFWDRWHITLTRFFTKYVYIPLGGNRKGAVRTYVNVFVVFFLSGFWHGAGLTFIAWGIFHGVFSVFTRMFKSFFEKLHPVLNWAITFVFLNFTWVFFRANSCKQGVKLIYKALKFDFSLCSANLLSFFKLPELEMVLDNIKDIHVLFPRIEIEIFLIASFIVVLGCKNSYEKMQNLKVNMFSSIKAAFLLSWCISSFSGISTFLYFNF